MAIFKMKMRRVKSRQWPPLFVCLYLALLAATMYNYLAWLSVNFLLGIMALVIFPVYTKTQKPSTRFGYIAAGLFLLFLWLPVKTFLYGALGCALFYGIESFYGRLNQWVLWVFALMSPIFEYAVNVFGFPIRLQLTSLAARLLTMSGTVTHTEGNILYCNGHEFSVDPACMGLNMMVTSLLTGLLLLAFYQEKYRRRLPVGWVFCLLAALVLLNIAANLFRIVGLAAFNILPQNPMHSIIGIACLLVYVMMPAFFLCRWLVRRFGRNAVPAAAPERLALSRVRLLCNVVAGICMLSAAGISLWHDNMQKQVVAMSPGAVRGYTTTRLPQNVFKLENGRSLVYIKPIAAFYYTDHTPMICWQGSGYDFLKIQEELVNGTKIYTGILQQAGEKLYTAWWYDNGTSRTLSQANWRWDMLRGARNYSLVNVTSASREQLLTEVQKIQRTAPFRQLLQ